MSDITPSSGSRESRNKAEKNRRDKLNMYVKELGELVPWSKEAIKRLDKTSHLRLAAGMLRIYRTTGLRPMKSAEAHWIDRALDSGILDTTGESFLMAISCPPPSSPAPPKILYVCNRMEKYLGYSKTDLIGFPFVAPNSNFIHHEDQLIVNQKLDECRSQGNRYATVFECRMCVRPQSRAEPVLYEKVLVKAVVSQRDRGRLKPNRSLKTIGSGNDHEATIPDDGSCDKYISAIVRMQSNSQTLPPMEYFDPLQDVYITEHSAEGLIRRSDHRISLVAGYFTEEVLQTSAFKYIWKEDQEVSKLAQGLMLSGPDGMGSVTYRLLTKTGTLIYLNSRGFIQKDSNGQVTGFVCINTLISEDEGVRQINELRNKLSQMNITGSLRAVTAAPKLVHHKELVPVCKGSSSAMGPIGAGPCTSTTVTTAMVVPTNGHSKVALVTRSNGFAALPVNGKNGHVIRIEQTVTQSCSSYLPSPADSSPLAPVLQDAASCPMSPVILAPPTAEQWQQTFADNPHYIQQLPLSDVDISSPDVEAISFVERVSPAPELTRYKNGLNGVRVNGVNGMNGLKVVATGAINGLNGVNGLNGIRGANGINGMNGLKKPAAVPATGLAPSQFQATISPVTSPSPTSTMNPEDFFGMGLSPHDTSSNHSSCHGSPHNGHRSPVSSLSAHGDGSLSDWSVPTPVPEKDPRNGMLSHQDPSVCMGKHMSILNLHPMNGDLVTSGGTNSA